MSRRTRFLVALVLLACVLLTLGFWLDFGAMETNGRLRDTPLQATQPPNKSASSTSNTPYISPKDSVPTKPDNPESSKPNLPDPAPPTTTLPTEPAKTLEATAPQHQERSLTFLLRLSDGNAVQGVSLRWTSLSVSELAYAMKTGMFPGQQVWRVSSPSDSSGRIVVTGDDVPDVGGAVCVSAATSGFVIHVPQSAGAIRAGGQSLILIKAARQECLLDVMVSFSFRVFIEFEDGEAFTGDIRIWTVSNGKTDHSGLKDLRLSGERDLRVDGIPSGATLMIRCKSFRSGFAPEFQFILTPEQLKLEPTCRIPRSDQPHCGLIVQLGQAASTETFAVRVFKSSGSVVDYGTVSSIEEFKTLKLWSGQAYRVHVRGRASAWESEDTFLKKDEVKTLTAEPLAFAHVQLQVVDMTGKPLWPAMLSFSVYRYSRLDSARKPRSSASFGDQGFARADGDGIILLRDAAPGTRVALVEALGYEPKLVEFSAGPGETVDLGRIALEPAQGKISIRLTNRRDGASYYVALLEPGAGPLCKPVMTDKESLSFEALAMRRYVIFVYFAEGQKGTSQPVSLTAAHPTATVEIDCSKVEHGR